MSKTEQANVEKDWKRKYFDSLRELETNEKNWNKVEDLLRLGISRLTLVAESTANKQLDDQIALLRKSIREGTESKRLVLLIENISDEIKKLPDATEKKSTDDVSTSNVVISELLDTILDSIIYNGDQRSKVVGFQKNLQSDNNDSDELTQQFSTLMSDLIKPEIIITPANNIPENNKPESNKPESNKPESNKPESNKPESNKPDSNKPEQQNSNVERRTDNRAANDLDNDIDRSMDSKTNSLVAPAVGELMLQLLTRFPPSFTKVIDERALARAASSARNRKDLLHIVDKMSQDLSLFIRNLSSKNAENSYSESNGEILIHLLQRISLPEYLTEQALKLKQTIEKADPKNSITTMVEATADLIMQMRVRLQAEKQELEQFLSEISEHLKALDIDIQITSRLRDESAASLQQYDEDLESEVRGLEESLDETIELDGLKQLVEERVKTIRLHMGAFRKSEEQRNCTADETIKKLTNRIDEMEQETKSLREEVEKEHNSAVRDALTNIPNRLAYEERIQSEIERCKRYNSPMAFVVWDIDHFKGINDHYGHIAGDKVLAVIAEVLKKNLRAADFIARYGGEEFVVIMPETEIDKAEKGCEKIRDAIESCNFHYRDTSVPITASCGYTSYKEGDSRDSLFDRADKALYKAKESGRNRCIKAT